MTLDNMTGITEVSYTGFCKSQLITCNFVKTCNGVCPFEDALKHADKMQTMNEKHTVDHDRDWIIGCIEHDGFIHTHRFDKANRIILEALQTDGVSREQYQRVIDTVANLTEEISSMVKVVRCKDCQHRAYDKYSDVWCCTKCGYELGEENDFCSLGERRKP